MWIHTGLKKGSSSQRCPLHLSPEGLGTHSSGQQTPNPFQGPELPQTHITPLKQPEAMPEHPAAASPGLVNSLPSCTSVSLPWPLLEATGAAQNYFSASVTKHKMHRAVSSWKLQLKPLWAIQRSSRPKSQRPPHPTSWHMVPLSIPWHALCFWQPDASEGETAARQMPVAARKPPCTSLSCAARAS